MYSSTVGCIFEVSHLIQRNTVSVPTYVVVYWCGPGNACAVLIVVCLTLNSFLLWQVPEEFLKNCFEKIRGIWENLLAYKKGGGGEEPESEENKRGYQLQVVELTRCLALLKEYAAEVDDCYPDERAYPPHGK